MARYYFYNDMMIDSLYQMNYHSSKLGRVGVMRTMLFCAVDKRGIGSLAI